MSDHQVYELIRAWSIEERLRLVELILRDIRLSGEPASGEKPTELSNKPLNPIVSMAGILEEEKAAELEAAVRDCRQINEHEW